MNNEKRLYRQIKKENKKCGNRMVRHYLKRQLKDHPEEAHWDEYDYGTFSTKDMNGRYEDGKRKNERYNNANFQDRNNGISIN